MRISLVGSESRPLSAVAAFFSKAFPEHQFEISRSLPARDALIFDERVAQNLFGKPEIKLPTLAGSHDATRNFVVCPPPQHLFTVPYGSFLLRTYAKKLFTQTPSIEFNWTLVDTPAKAERAKEVLLNAAFFSVDIETGPHSSLLCIGFGTPTESFVFPTTATGELYFWQTVENLLDSDVPKVFHNGLYDLTHLIRHSFRVRAYYFDTLALLHSFCAELPRDLAFSTLLFVPGISYWKDESSGALYEYNGKDCQSTALLFRALVKTDVDFLFSNYLIQFPLTFPTLDMNLRGIKIDREKRTELASIATEKAHENERFLWRLFGPQFNPRSPPQVKKVLSILSNREVESSDAKTLREWALENPFFAKIADAILSARESEKLLSSYFSAPLLGDRILFSLNPFGTETGRMSCAKSALYGATFDEKYGLNFQTIPEEIKPIFIPSKPDWKLYEIDKSASESYCTAWLSKEENLLNALKTAPDFHLWNASLFFGIPFEELWLDGKGKKINKDLRDLAKRINHGANYNMTAPMLALTMGSTHIYKARKLLNLPSAWGPMKICDYLLSCFDKAYPRIRKDWQREIIAEVTRTRKLTNPISNWVRLTFEKPAENKLALNALVAHGPQHLSVYLVNRGLLEVYKELANRDDFRLIAQIHDSLLFETPNHSLALRVKEIFDSTGNGIPSELSPPLDRWMK